MEKRLSKKGALFDPINLIAGILVIVGGISIMLDKINLGTLLTTIGFLIEVIKLIIKQGL